MRGPIKQRQGLRFSGRESQSLAEIIERQGWDQTFYRVRETIERAGFPAPAKLREPVRRF